MNTGTNQTRPADRPAGEPSGGLPGSYFGPIYATGRRAGYGSSRRILLPYLQQWNTGTAIILLRRQNMSSETTRAKIVALGILLAFTVTVYFGWRANNDVENANWIEHITVQNTR